MRLLAIALLLLTTQVAVLRADDDALRDLGTNAAPGEIPKWDGSQWRNAHDNITTVNPGPGLSGGMTNGEITVGVTFGGQRTNNLVAAFSDMDATRPPIGAIVAWAKSIPGVSSNLPAGWLECNGQTLTDTNSVLNGQTIPNLNGFSGNAKRFLRGAATSGTIGGNDTVSHTHGNSQGGAGYGWGNTAGYAINISASDVNLLPSFYEVVWIMRVK